ncbi:hypothetical protein [Rhodoblastus acidophilus]|uniref:hypothetical protein n=1 Tax=Rhodoblastus acidophilus TaxID=1074 RepID=UPI000B5114F7|nr:hypothetical protein [Rhodoblastus acidophilus]PPQ37285.1 hypothetical protein CKO16_15170 [Rhodoblastus acidophilus]RAI16449.1 hypothetical protein CH337_21275 [Rhodoblastus acidophilus]
MTGVVQARLQKRMSVHVKTKIAVAHLHPRHRADGGETRMQHRLAQCALWSRKAHNHERLRAHIIKRGGFDRLTKLKHVEQPRSSFSPANQKQLAAR